MSRAKPNLWLKQKTRQLIKACGGLTDTSRVCAEDARPYSVPHLSRCQNVNAPDFMPIDIVLCLEAYCGEPIITAAMAEARPAQVEAGDFRDELSDVVEGAAALLGRYRTMLADKRLDAAERVQLYAGLEDLVREAREAQASLMAMAPDLGDEA